MLISHSRRFIFVHVNRAAGGSVIRALEPFGHSPPPGRVNKVLSKLHLQRDPEKIRFRAHETALGLQRILPREMLDSYFTFAFVRNPWSWLVSMYFRFKTTTSHRHHKPVARLAGFPEYVDFEIGRDKRTQRAFVTDANEDLLVDFVGRLENLKRDFDIVCDRLEIPRADLPHVGARKHKDYRDYYDEATRDKVARHWARDVELFGYDFDGVIGGADALPLTREPLAAPADG